MVAPAQWYGPLNESTKIDEFGRLPDCELKSRVDALFISMGNNEGSRGYVIIYRGATAPASERDELAFGTMKRRFESFIAFRKYDPAMVEFIDGGFRDYGGLVVEFFLVPANGVLPTPTDTVEQPVLSLDTTFIAETGWIWFEDARIVKDEPEIVEEYEVTPPDPDTVDEYPAETEIGETEPAYDEESGYTEQERESIEPGTPEYDESQRAEFWEKLLKANSDARGTIVFYADDQEYDLSIAKSLIEDWLQRTAKNSGLDLTRVAVVYGGYRESLKAEFWFVPKRGEAVIPKPDARPLAEPAKSVALVGKS